MFGEAALKLAIKMLEGNKRTHFLQHRFAVTPVKASNGSKAEVAWPADVSGLCLSEKEALTIGTERPNLTM